jgi:hypothetical protein
LEEGELDKLELEKEDEEGWELEERGGQKKREKGSGYECRKDSDRDRKKLGEGNLSRTTDNWGRFCKGLKNKVDLVLTKQMQDGTLLGVEVQI